MHKVEVVKLLTVASAVDSRKVAPPMIEAWFLSVGDLSYDVASKALEIHWRESTEWLLPAHIRALAARAQDAIARAADEAARVEWLRVLGLTMDDYREHWEEPGWIDQKNLEFSNLQALRSLS